jgi:uncharacterized protein YuzB (UPF0349 family)
MEGTIAALTLRARKSDQQHQVHYGMYDVAVGSSGHLAHCTADDDRLVRRYDGEELPTQAPRAGSDGALVAGLLLSTMSAELEEEWAMAQAQEARSIMVEGQEEGDPEHCCMGMYELVEGKVVNRRGVWQHSSSGSDTFLYFNSIDTNWWISISKKPMETGEAAGCIHVTSSALTPDRATAQWRVSDGSTFQVAPKLRVHVMSAEQQQAELQRLAEEQAQAMAQAQETRSIMVEGQEKGDCQHSRMGMYKLMEGKVVKGRGVWQHQGGIKFFMYYTSMSWWISRKEDMEAGKAAGWITVESSALTPDRATAQWHVCDSSTFHDAPKLRVYVMSAEQQHAELQRLAEEQAQAMVQAQEARSIMVEGQEEGDYQYGCMGMYELVEGKVVSGRGVWQHQGDNDLFLYFCSSMAWYISSKESMEAGKAAGFVHVTSSALTPDQATTQWRVANDSAFQDAPKLRVRVMSAEQQQAELQRLAKAEESTMAQAQETKSIMVEGQEEGDPGHCSMGVYELMEGKVVNGRGVWQQQGGIEFFIYYTSMSWWINDEESMEAGKALGWITVESSALTPDRVTAQWRVANDSIFHDAPKMRVRVMSAEQQHAELQRLADKKQAAGEK